jgi:hypothetical protein
MNAFPIIFDRRVTLKLKGAGIIVMLLAASNAITYLISNLGANKQPSNTEIAGAKPSFYLADQAAKKIDDVAKFESKLRRVCRRLSIPPEWLMTVIFFESGFQADAVNAKGSGATGLLQWRREEAEIIGMTPENIKSKDAFEQLELIEQYLKKVREYQGKDFDYLTDLYLAAFYPQALGEDYCYAMFQKGEINYQRYAPLDTNNDGRITVKDIDDRLKNQFPTAYMIDKQSAETWWAWFSWF